MRFDFDFAARTGSRSIRARAERARIRIWRMLFSRAYDVYHVAHLPVRVVLNVVPYKPFSLRNAPFPFVLDDMQYAAWFCRL